MFYTKVIPGIIRSTFCTILTSAQLPNIFIPLRNLCAPQSFGFDEQNKGSFLSLGKVKLFIAGCKALKLHCLDCCNLLKKFKKSSCSCGEKQNKLRLMTRGINPKEKAHKWGIFFTIIALTSLDNLIQHSC